MEGQINFGCGEEFAELCALSTSGCLSVEEEEKLATHVAHCGDCALLLNQYKAVAFDGMATLASTRVKDVGSQQGVENARELKKRVLKEMERIITVSAPPGTPRTGALDRIGGFFRVPVPAWVAAMLLLAVGAGYVFGSMRRQQALSASAQAEAVHRKLATDIQSQLNAAKEDLEAVSARSSVLQNRAETAERELSELRTSKAALEQKLQVLLSGAKTDSNTIVDLTAARDALGQRLHESEGQLQFVQQQLKAAQDERQGAVLRAANLEFQVNQLTAELREINDAAHRSEQYLASDRDIRELMGARQLYIADVFDIDPQGKTKKPFGRVFYTKGKSLIFYAFDLDQHPGFREAKTFQAWGRPGTTNGKPVSLGIFYLDNEENRRWALKFTDPKVLDEINSLFVTVEPKGGSTRPTNKAFLVAFLHSAAPNHP